MKGISGLALALAVFWGASDCARAAEAGATLESAAAPERLKVFNLRVNPMSFIFGALDLGAELLLVPHVSIGGVVDFYHGQSFEVGPTNDWGLGLNATWYVTNIAFESGFIVRPEFYFVFVRPYSNVDHQVHTVDLSKVLGSTVGYNWRLTRSGLNTSLATGLAVRRDRHGQGYAYFMQPILEWTLGWAF